MGDSFALNISKRDVRLELSYYQVICFLDFVCT